MPQVAHKRHRSSSLRVQTEAYPWAVLQDSLRGTIATSSPSAPVYFPLNAKFPAPRQAGGKLHCVKLLAASSRQILFRHQPNKGFTSSHVVSLPSHQAPGGQVSHRHLSKFPEEFKYCRVTWQCFATCHGFDTADHGLGVRPTTRTRACKTLNVSGRVTFKITEKDDVVVEFVPGPKVSSTWLH